MKTSELLTPEAQLQIAQKLYTTASEESRANLLAIFGRDAFPKDNNPEEMDFDEILVAAGVSQAVKDLIAYDGDDEELIGVRGFMAISAIRKVYNQNKTIDYTSDKYKYYVWVDMRTASGAGFSRSNYDSWFTNSDCGSRLCFLESKMALLAIKKFPHYFADMFNIRNQVPAVQLRVLKTA